VSVVAVEGLEKSYGAHTVFSGVSFALAWGERAGLVGPNGAGKTTLLEVLAGLRTPDAGRVALARAARIGYLPQDPALPADGTVRGAALQAFAELAGIEARLSALGAELEAGDASPVTLQAYGELQARFEEAGGYEREHTAEAALDGLGLPRRLWDSPPGHLSGGQRVRLALCRLLLGQPDLLLCDEPTNHLDADAVSWLEGRLQRWNGALLCVSHDRYFLDRVCTRILELSQGLQSYVGAYTAYARQREERTVAAAEERARAAGEEERLRAYVERYRAGNRARQAKSREHRLERLREAAPAAGPAAAAAPTLRFRPRSATGREVLAVEGLAKSFGATPLFAPWDALVFRGERIGIVGSNGAGKTTLLRVLAGEEPADAGGAFWGRGVEVSWFRQDMAGLAEQASVLDNVLGAREELGAAEARHILARFLFRGDSVFRLAGELSGGERNRLLLCLLSLQQGNVLFCDEPTNHLDIPAREALEAALAEFPGTLLVVSHDRYLLQRLCTRIWWLEGGRVTDLAEGYAAYAERRERPQGPAAPQAPRVRERRPAGPGGAERRRLAALAALEAEIAAAEAEVAALEERLGQSELYRDGTAAAAVVAAYESGRARLEGLYAQWEGLGQPQGQDSSPSGRR